MVQPSASSPATFSLNPKVWLHAFIFDGAIAFSWLFFVGFGIAYYSWAGGFGGVVRAWEGFGALDTRRASLLVGYWGWSLYWGVPGWLAITRRIRGRLFGGHYAIGCAPWILVFFVLQFIALALYPPFGGGLFHFVRRWWFAGTHTHLPVIGPPPVATAQLPTQGALVSPTSSAPSAAGASIPFRPDVEQRLRALNQLLQRGAISQQEHDQQRDAIIRTI